MYQDLDGVNRYEGVERLRQIALQLHPASRSLDLLILFSGLGKWLNKPRNVSRVLLTGTVTEAELRGVIASVQRLDAPRSEVERAVAAAILIDAAGVRGLAERFAHARREGLSVEDVARELPPEIPQWIDARAREWMMARLEQRQRFCDVMLNETKSRA